MVTDPYKVLGISPGATPDEIKKAYRKKAKEYHPDLHPDEPGIAEKMSEVNEAYDMLMNPEKHSRQQYHQQQNNQYGEYRGYSYGGFDFNDIFGNFYQEMPFTPHIMSEDTPEIIKVISEINMKNYQNALILLNRIENSKRNARWYYLSALANYGIRNTVAALNQIQIALRLEPGNIEYQKVYSMLARSGNTYTQTGRSYGMDLGVLERICWGICLFRLCCPFC